MQLIRYARLSVFNALTMVTIYALASTRMLADDIQPLGDEFGNAATFNRYQEYGALEGWGVFY